MTQCGYLSRACSAAEEDATLSNEETAFDPEGAQTPPPDDFGDARGPTNPGDDHLRHRPVGDGTPPVAPGADVRVVGGWSPGLSYRILTLHPLVKRP